MCTVDNIVEDYPQLNTRHQDGMMFSLRGPHGCLARKHAVANSSANHDGGILCELATTW